MGTMLRSDRMAFCEIYLQHEAVFDIIAALGELGCVEFLDASSHLSASQKRYVPELCRVAEMERKLRYIKSEMDKDKVLVPTLIGGKDPVALRKPMFDTYETQLEKWENDIIEMTAYQRDLMKNYEKLSELYYMLSNIGPIIGEAEFRKESWLNREAGDASFASGARLQVLTGVVARNKSYSMQLMLWRISRGNVYFKLAARDAVFDDPVTGKEVRKVAFVAVSQGEKLSNKVEKICLAFQAHLYNCPKTFGERQAAVAQLKTRLEDLDKVIKKTRYYRCKALRTMSHNWHKWTIEVRKAKAVYVQMNLFTLDVTRNCLINHCWVPERDLPKVVKLLEKCSEDVSPNVESFMYQLKTDRIHPTYHRTNKFTKGFQVLINAYGESKYRELNPGLYTVITFPFLFAVMFGDMGHGLLIFSFAMWMILREKEFIAQRSTNEIWNIFFGGRYVILMMSLFTLYTGFIYNEVFSKPLSIFRSSYQNYFTSVDLYFMDPSKDTLKMDPGRNTLPTYPAGVDPAWTLAKNKILFDNSLKMKLSIILGVTHMLFGLTLSFFNHVYFHKYHKIFFQFIPQILFLSCIFGWLVFLIYFKWIYYGTKKLDINYRTSCAPLILIHFIDMCLFRTSKAPDPGCKAYMFDYQELIQKILVVIALLCIPVLLLGTPLWVYAKRKYDSKPKKPKKKKPQKEFVHRLSYLQYDGTSQAVVNQEQQPAVNQGLKKRDERPFSELMILQGVHTIEFVLSTISHTASYLRLWALSLAHAELAEMLWRMILSKLALRDHTMIGAIKLFPVFAIWAIFTLGILVMMEGLSAFLHTLRLHWVEFMSKFYMGGGILFVPFNLKNAMHTDVKDEAEGACKPKNPLAM